MQPQQDSVLYSGASSVNTHPRQAGTLQDATPELASDASVNRLSELATDPDRSLIDGPAKSNSNSPTSTESNHAQPSSAVFHYPTMGPNFDMASNNEHGFGNDAERRHMLSWMDYQGNTGLQR